MTLALAVMMIEATGDIQYALPLMVAVMFAKFVGDRFNSGGVYELKIRQAHLPFLEPDPPYEAEFLQAKHVMNRDIRCLPMVCKVDDILRALNQTQCNGFPIVGESTSVSEDPDDSRLPRKWKKTKVWGKLRGLILKKHLVTLLARKAFIMDKTKPIEGKRQAQLTWGDFERKYPRYPELREEIGRAVQQECRDRSRMPSSA
eukprot:TRINITY_DN28882_c0_g2_i1.p1 TRINITY_DN28882_c0_g2~~TRINITY_DN28882_c0_g2_i1.p1  ORF type:complete len:202 (+),score=24.79 TRINITY_DN28882_c0_g2_i1:226-831(+)